MNESMAKSTELRKIRLKQRQLSTKLKSFTSQDASLLDPSTFESQLKSMEAACFEVTDLIDEMIMDLEDSEENNDKPIAYLDKKKEKVLTALHDSKHKLVLRRNKTNVLSDNHFNIQGKKSKQTEAPDSLKMKGDKGIDFVNQNFDHHEQKVVRFYRLIPHFQ